MFVFPIVYPGMVPYYIHSKIILGLKKIVYKVMSVISFGSGQQPDVL